MIRIRSLGLAAALALVGATVARAQSPAAPPHAARDARDIHHDRRDLRYDRRDIRSDRRDPRRDRRHIRHDRRDLHQDRPGS